MHDYKVSVLMSVYNEKREYLKLSIESILKQSYNDFEFVIIDDCSDYYVEELIKKYMLQDKRIRYFRNNRNLGLAESLNLGIHYCSSNMIFRMDSDDVSDSNRIKEQLNFLINDINEDVGVLGTNIAIINSEGEKIASRKFPETTEQIRKYLPYRSPFCHPSVAFRKNVVLEAGGYDTNLRKGQDYDLWFRLAKMGIKMVNLDSELLKFRQIINQLKFKRSRNHRLSDLRMKWKHVWDFSFGLRGYVGLLIPIIQIAIPNKLQYKIYLQTLKKKRW